MRDATIKHLRRFCLPEHLLGIACALVLAWVVPYKTGEVAAQAISPITSSGLNTQVEAAFSTPGGQIQFEITGGTRAGANLFHSFGEFNVPTNNIASFFNDSALPTSNVLGRVTGGNPSSIFGTLEMSGFGSANLFLMNPAGIVFGPNATLNAGGSVTFTTANYLRFAESDGANAGIFHADPFATSILTTAPVSAFGFVSSHPTAISVHGSTLSVSPGQSISLVGGSEKFNYHDPDNGAVASVAGGVTIASGTVSAPSGAINIASMAFPGELSAGEFTAPPGAAIGNVHFTDSSMLTVSGDSSGTIRIRGGAFTIEESTLAANTSTLNAHPLAIDINATGDLTIANNTIPALTARTTGEGDAGKIRIISGTLSAQTITDNTSFALIDTHTSGTGHAGRVTIETESLDARIANNGGYLIDSGTSAKGNGNNVTITATHVTLQNANINTGDFRAIFSTPQNFNATGSGGDIAISADNISLQATVLASQAFQGQGGDIALTGHEIMLNGASLIGTTGFFGSGAVLINTHRFTMTEASQIESVTVFSPGKDINISASELELSDGSTIRTQTGGPGAAGNIIVSAVDRVLLSGEEASIRPSGFYSNSIGIEDVDPSTLGGNAGSISIITPHLELRGGARLDTTTQTSGRGGDVTIVANDLVTISGERIVPIPEDFFTVGSDTAGGIFTRTIGNVFCSGPCGAAGGISITTNTLTLGRGSLLDSSTTSTGRGGEISIHAVDRISLSDTLADGSPVGIFSRTIGTEPGSDSGGNVAIAAGQSVTISDGASVSASSTGPGNAGNIAINAGQQLDMQDSSVTTEAAQASGGNIDIQAMDRVRLVNSSISTSVLGGAGGGGNITIDPNVVVLQNSQVIAQAVQGAGGNITITTPLFLADSTSLVDASSDFGLNGTVTIQSPTSNLSGSLGPLTSKPSQAQSLLTQRCAALANGQISSFVVAGREQLPADPGGWLSSPLAFAAFGESLDEGHAVASTPAVMAIATHDTGTVSLRRLTPAGFLVANFSDSEATGCHS